MKQKNTSAMLIYILIFITVSAGLFGSILFTELGQLLNLPSEWLYAVYPNLGWASIAVAIAAVVVLLLNQRGATLGRKLMITYVVFVAGTLFVTNYFVPEIWLRGHHHTAEFVSIQAADDRLSEMDDVFVLEINGEARAYPRDWMMVPHIAGDTVGGDEVVMTYCALSNLPLAYSTSIDGQQGHLKVVSQVHNNLVMVNETSGELYQQITSSTPDGKSLEPRPAMRMPWKSFKSLYPNGLVFDTTTAGILGLLDKITYALFVGSLDGHYNGEKPLFPTLSMNDDRLPAKEQIWGVSISGEQVAFTRSFLEKTPLYSTTIGGQPTLIAWFPEYDTLGVFSREINGKAVDVSSVNVHGHTGSDTLERLPQYPNVFWMIWSHWYPQTALKT